MIFTTLLNFKAFILILGGFVSIILAVTIKYFNRKRKISDTKITIEKAIQMEPSLRSKFGDIDAYLDQDPLTQDIHFFDELILNSVQPLLLLSILSLFDFTNPIIIIFLIIILIFSYAHEIYMGEEYKKKRFYRIIVFSLWLSFYTISCFGYSETVKKSDTPSNKTNKLIDSTKV